nr:hypothetical protein [uncultured Oscillibacter sp.]
MSDFMRWLYDVYIQPQLYEIHEGEYTEYFQNIMDSLPDGLFPDLRKCEEFTAVHAFLLGFHTGAGLSSAARQP